MAETQAGITALITAYPRAYHATHDTPVIFDDSIADQYYSPEEHASFDQNLASMLPMIDPAMADTHPDHATALAAVMQTIHEPVTLSRSRFCEDSLEEAVKHGTTQYINLGAGFDTFAFRRTDLLDRLKVFELDHPVTQSMKRERIAQAGWRIPHQLELIPIDFNKESLIEVLFHSDYDPAQVSFFCWLGVTYYLPKDVIFSTLKDIRAMAVEGSTVVFDYMDSDSFLPEKVAPRTALMHAIARQVGEPMKSGFDPQSLAKDLRPLGLELAENLGPVELNDRYFRGRTDRLRAFEHVHIARAICV